MRRISIGALTLLLAFIFVNCTNKGPTAFDTSSSTPSSPTPPELTREIVLSLLAAQKQPITVSFERGQHETYGRENYERMIADKIINCTKTYPLKMGDQVVTDVYYYSNCTPGANGKDLRVNGTSLDVVIGNKRPSKVTGISKVDSNSAYADVLMVFEQTPGYDLYEKYKVMFNPYGTVRLNVQNESHRALFRLYDDGWRLERFN